MNPKEFNYFSDILKALKGDFERNKIIAYFDEEDEIPVDELIDEGKSFREINEMYKERKEKRENEIFACGTHDFFKSAWDLYNKFDDEDY